MDLISTPLFLKVLPTIAKYAGEQALSHLRTPAAIAIARTSAEFAKYPGVREWLHNWCTSPEFLQLQASLKEGDRVDESQVVLSFARFVGSVNPDISQRCSEEVLPIFFRKIDEQLLGSPGLAIIEQRSESRHDEILSSQQDLLGEFRALSSRLQPIASQDELSPGKQEEVAFDSRLNVVKQLLDSGHANAAKGILVEVETKISDGECSTHLRFPLEALTGNCLLQLGEPTKAAERLRIAIALNAKDARSRSNLSQALAWSGNLEEAFYQASESNNLAPDDPYVSVFLQRLSELNRTEEIDELSTARSLFLSDAFFLRAVAENLHRHKRFEEAAQLLGRNVKQELVYAPALELLGRCLLSAVQAELRRDLPLPWLYRVEVRQKILEAEAAFSQAIDLLEKTDARSEIAAVYANRGLARIWLGQTEGAETDYDRALTLKPDFDEAKPIKALMLIDKRDFQAAINLLRPIEPSHASPEGHTVLAMAFMQTGQPRNAIEHLKATLKFDGLEQRTSVRTVGMMAEAHRQLGETSIAKNLVDDALITFPNEAEAQFLLAEHKEKTGHIEEARRIIETVYSSSDKVTRPIIAVAVAAFYWRQRLFAEAAQVYEELAAPGMDPALRFHYAVSLLNAGERRKVYDLAREARLKEGFSPELVEVEVQISEEIGDLKGANSLLNEVIVRRPDQAGYFRVRIATNYYRMGEDKHCKEIVSSIAASELRGAPELLMQVAKLRHWLDMNGSLEFAYEAWITGSDRPEIALSYAFISLARGTRDSQVLETEAASSGCRVQLRREDEARVVDLVDESEVEFPPKRVRVTSALGRRLIGLRTGDHINLGDGNDYRVESILTKYVAAHQDVLRDFSFSFPEHPGLRRMEVVKNDLTPVFTMLEARHDFATAALRLYREKRMTLGTLSSVLGETMLEVWLSLAGSEHERFLAASGRPEETQRELQTVAMAKEIVIEPTALMTLARLSRMDVLRRRFDRIYVAQHVLDDFLEARAKREFGPSSGGWMGKVGDRYVFTDHPDRAFLDDYDAILRNILAFLNDGATVVPCHLQLEYPRSKFEHLRRVLGNGPIASALVAKELGLPLYSDDFGLRQIALNDWQVSGFWTQPLLLNVTGALLSIDDYFCAVTALIQHHYHFVQINAKYLLWLFAANNLTLSPEVVRGVNLLRDGECSIASAVAVAADVVVNCWANSLPNHFKHMVLDAVLSAVIEGRSASLALAAFKIAITARVAAGTRALAEINVTLRLWERVQLTGTSL
jgi:tetratricopeptide (TPR) repeat protein